MLEIALLDVEVSTSEGFFDGLPQLRGSAYAGALFKKFVVGLSLSEQEYRIVKVAAFGTPQECRQLHGY